MGRADCTDYQHMACVFANPTHSYAAEESRRVLLPSASTLGLRSHLPGRKAELHLTESGSPQRRAHGEDYHVHLLRARVTCWSCRACWTMETDVKRRKGLSHEHLTRSYSESGHALVCLVECHRVRIVRTQEEAACMLQTYLLLALHVYMFLHTENRLSVKGRVI